MMGVGLAFQEVACFAWVSNSGRVTTYATTVSLRIPTHEEVRGGMMMRTAWGITTYIRVRTSPNHSDLAASICVLCTASTPARTISEINAEYSRTIDTVAATKGESWIPRKGRV
jgi:hypothetical protein